MTIFNDAVKLETQEGSFRRVVGWFRDEVSAIGAAVEHVLVQSAMLPELRKLPELMICSEYKALRSGHAVVNFIRATVSKSQPQRRIVLTPGASAKSWVR